MKLVLKIAVAFLVCTIIISQDVENAMKRACTVYCEGEILSTIQMAKLFNDSKTFVDMPMKFDPEEVYVNFNNIINKSDIQQLEILSLRILMMLELI